MHIDPELRAKLNSGDPVTFSPASCVALLLALDGGVEVANKSAWVARLWRDWPQNRRDGVRALSVHLHDAIEDLAHLVTQPLPFPTHPETPMTEQPAIDMTSIPDCPLAPYIAQAWHDVTCPEGPDCRDRLMHSAAQPLAYTGTVQAFLDRLDELKAPR